MSSGIGRKEIEKELGLVCSTKKRINEVYIEKLSCSNRRLLMGKDKDKRLRQLSPEPQTTGVQSSKNCVEAEEFQKQTDLVKCRKQVSSFKESRSKTNGHNSANNNPMTALKYFGSSAQAFFKLLPHQWSLIPTSSTFYCNHANCHRRCTRSSSRIESPQKENGLKGRFLCCNNSSWEKFSFNQLIPRFLFVIFVLFILLTEIVQSSSASPIPNIPAPTQTITNAAFSSLTISDENRVKPSFESTKLEEDNGEENPQQRVNPVHQLMLVNNSRGLMDISNDYSAVKRVVESNHGNDDFTIESAPALRSSSDRVSFVDDYGNSDVISGNHLDELTFVITQKHKNANKNKHDFNGGPHPKEELLGDEDGGLRNQALEHPTLPTAQHQRVLQVTNDVLPPRRKQSNRNGIIALSSININSSSSSNDTDNDSADSISFTTTSTSFTGQCWLTPWSNDQEGNLDEAKKTELIGVSSPKLLSFPSVSLSFKESISVFCNDTGNLPNLLNQISETLVPQVISLHVKDSSISILNLSLFRRFPNLQSLSVTNSNVTQIIGNCPEGLKALNISFNNVKKLDGSLFGVSSHKNYDDDEEEEDDEEDEDSDDQNDDEDNDTLESESIRRNFSMPERKGSTNLPSSAAPNSLQLQNTNKSPSASPIGKTSSSSRFSKGHHSEKLDMATPVALPENNILLPMLRKSRSVKPVDSRKSHFKSHISIFHNESGAGKNVNQPTQSVESSTVESESEEYLSSSKEFESDTYGDKIGNIKTKFYDERSLSGLSSFPTDEASASTISPVDSIGCGINDYLCKMGYSQEELFPTQPQQMNRSEQKSDDEIIPGELKSKRLFSHKMIKGENHTSNVKKVASEEGDFYSGEGALSPSSTFSDASSSGSNKKGNEIKVGSKSTRFLQGVHSGTQSPGDDRNSHPVRARKRSSGFGTSSNLSLEDIDLSHNKISEVPRDLLELKSLKSLRLSGNQLRCDFVWEKLADWYMNLDSEILKDGDDTFCGVVDDVRVFQYTVLGVLKAKKDVVKTCRAVDKNICHDCGLYSLNKQPGHGYNLSHTSPRGNVAIALKLDCSLRNLTELPSVPPQTWQINVSGNAIEDLSSLKEPMYENLLILDGDSNEISSLDGLTGTPFLDKFNYLSLQNNRFLTIPTNILTSLKNMRGQGITLLGDNFIECDCDVVKEIKPLLLENTKQIKDLKEIYCKDMKTAAGAFTAVKDIQYSDLCYLETEESNEMYLYLIIVVELLLIFVIVAKVWHDQRTFRRSGVLPWCSRKIPRLPCDAMLESVKEPPHFNRSSSTNVRSFACEHPTTQSISSHVQLREVRSNSGQSEKSSQISHLSSFPCSSRTSSV